MALIKGTESKTIMTKDSHHWDSQGMMQRRRSNQDGGYNGYPNGSSSAGGGGGGAGVSYGGYTGQNSYDYDTPLAPACTNGHLSHGTRKRHDALSPLPKIFKDKWVWTLLVCIVLFSTTLYYRGKHSSTLKRLNVKSIDDAVKLLSKAEKSKWDKDKAKMPHGQDDDLKKRLEHLEAENRALKKDRDEIQIKYEDEKLKKGSTKIQPAADDAQWMAREKALTHQIELLQNATKRESKRGILDKFGPGPHRVKLTLAFPDDEEGVEHYIVVEMAPLDVLPHATHLFLEQVAHRLWDGCGFYLNGPHVLQAGPQDYEHEEEGFLMHRFLETKLDKLTFPEYSEDFPHLPLTLGFTGRPGGPDFYINKANNTIPHGPGGQSQHGLLEQADPCFAIIIEGQEIVRKMHELPTYPKDHEFQFFLEEPVEIVSAIIMDTPRDISMKKNMENKRGDARASSAEHHQRKPLHPRNQELEKEIEEAREQQIVA